MTSKRTHILNFENNDGNQPAASIMATSNPIRDSFPGVATITKYSTKSLFFDFPMSARRPKNLGHKNNYRNHSLVSTIATSNPNRDSFLGTTATPRYSTKSSFFSSDIGTKQP